MNSTGIITAMILVCLGLLVLIILAKPIKFLLKFFISALVGGTILYFCNSVGFGLGANFLTTAFVGLLGIPGLAGLLVLSIFL